MPSPVSSGPSAYSSREPLLKTPIPSDDISSSTYPYHATKDSGLPHLVESQGSRSSSKRNKGRGNSSGDEASRGRKGGKKHVRRRFRRHEMRSQSPPTVEEMANTYVVKKKLFLAALTLALSLVSFVIQTEATAYIHALGWKKSYTMLYFTHSTCILLWPLTVLFLRFQKRTIPWKAFLRSHLSLVRTTALMVRYQSRQLSHSQATQNPLFYMVKQISLITCALTVAATTWYVAVNLTTPSDLTAIYNCSAFFAYAFSIPLLHEKLRSGKVLSVALAIIGVMIVAYGDGGSTDEGDNGDQPEISNRLLGNIIIGVGSVLYGLYEVLYKKLACPPQHTSPGRSAIFAIVVGTGIGLVTATLLWIPIPILHILDIERFELPTGKAAWFLIICMLSNITFAASFLILMSLTSPVLSSVSALLTIFLVAVVDFFLTGVPLTFAAILGGLVIIVAFGMLAWDTWQEMKEEAEQEKMEDVEEDEYSDAEAAHTDTLEVDSSDNDELESKDEEEDREGVERRLV